MKISIFFFKFEISKFQKITFVKPVTGNIYKQFGWKRKITESSVLNFFPLATMLNFNLLKQLKF